MCFGGKPKVDNSALEWQQAEANRARRQEAARQARIDRGLDDIAAIFDGGRYKTGTKSVRKRVGRPKIEQFFKTIKREAPAGFGGEADGQHNSGGGINSRVKRFRVGDKVFHNITAARKFREGLSPFKTVKKDTFANSAGITPYLDQRRSALEAFNFGQLDDQAQTAGDDLIASLSRAGLMRSTVATEKKTDLAREIDKQAAKIASNIDADIAGVRSNFSSQRAQIESDLRASGDRSSASKAATRTLSNMQSDPGNFDILPAIFSGFSSGIGAVREGYDAGEISRRLDQSMPELRTRGSGRTIG